MNYRRPVVEINFMVSSTEMFLTVSNCILSFFNLVVI
jgi:hypothetical protein